MARPMEVGIVTTRRGIFKSSAFWLIDPGMTPDSSRSIRLGHESWCTVKCLDAFEPVKVTLASFLMEEGRQEVELFHGSQKASRDGPDIQQVASELGSLEVDLMIVEQNSSRTSTKAPQSYRTLEIVQPRHPGSIVPQFQDNLQLRRVRRGIAFQSPPP